MGNPARPRFSDYVGVFVANLFTGVCGRVEFNIDDHPTFDQVRGVIQPAFFRLQSDVVANMVEPSKLFDPMVGILVQSQSEDILEAPTRNQSFANGIDNLNHAFVALTQGLWHRPRVGVSPRIRTITMIDPTNVDGYETVFLQRF